MIGGARGRFLPLLISLGVLFVVHPVMGELGVARLFRIFFIFVLVAAVYSVGERRRQLVVVLALAIPTAVAQLVVVTVPSERALLVAVSLALLFVAYLIVVVLGAVLQGGRVTGDRIAGAICAYLLLGLAWAMVYGLIALVQPGSFDTPTEMEWFQLAGSGIEYGFIYFSFVTLTTLGYGDITPLSSFARTVAWIEAVTGQLYIAVLVARLVALQIMHGSSMTGEDG